MSQGNETEQTVQTLSCWRNPAALVRLGVMLIVGLAADLASKAWAVRTLGDPLAEAIKPVEVIEGYVRFATVFNHGAVGGFASGKTALLVIVSIAALFFLLWFFGKLPPKSWLSQLAIGAVVAGALGNLHDRLFNNGCVVDFIEVNLHVWPANPWPTFNIADVLLCVGLVFLIGPIMMHKPEEEASIARKGEREQQTEGAREK